MTHDACHQLASLPFSSASSLTVRLHDIHSC